MINSLYSFMPLIPSVAGGSRDSYANRQQQSGDSFESLLVGISQSINQRISGQSIGIGSTASSVESILVSGGPLPAFLHEMDVRLHLNATQRQALREIAIENKDIIKTPETVHKIAMELQLAGIYGMD